MRHPRFRDIDPQVMAGVPGIISALDAADPSSMTVEGIPAFRARVAAWLASEPPPAEVPDVAVTIETLTLADGYPLRLAVYRPTRLTGPLPGLFHIHSGGMISGSIDTERSAMASLAAATQSVVVSVDYRLAPEHPHPIPVEDCYAGLAWTAEHAGDLGIDGARMVIGGESAGGGLAAGTALLARDRHGPALRFQYLVYPMLDDRNDSSSALEFGADWPVWPRELNAVGWRALLGDEVGGPDVSPYAAPARATNLAGLPAAYVDCGGLEVFRDESIDYARRLASAGIVVELHIWPGVFHGWEGAAPEAAVTRQATAARLDALRRGLHGHQPTPGAPGRGAADG
jgi:acetyl esterase/lipase